MIHALDIDFSWMNGDLPIFLPIILTSISFTIYWFVANSEPLKARFYSRFSFDWAAAYHITFNRIVGFVSMGILPLIICLILLPEYAISDYGISFNPDTFIYSILWITGLSFIVVPLAFKSAQSPKNLINYPQIRSKIWTKELVLINVFGWAIYLLGYELLFRGILLIPLSDQIGIWPAIAVNIALYSATHIPKGLSETIGAIPLGLILCLLTLSSGTIWIAFFTHLVMALTSSFASLKFHPEMKFVKHA